MRIPRVVVPAAASGRLLELTPDEAHHLVRVLRRRRGDEVVAVGEAGEAFGACVEKVDEAGDGVRVFLQIGEPLEDAPPILPWTAAVALVKGADMDAAVRLASELGLERLVPLRCERSEIRGASGKPARWARIASQAAKQCRRAQPLQVGATAGIREVLEGADVDRRWIAQPGAAPAAMEDFRGPSDILPALFLVGPEGGFSADEVREALDAGARPLGFRTPVLRTATAVLLIAAMGAFLGYETKNRVDGGKGAG